MSPNARPTQTWELQGCTSTPTEKKCIRAVHDRHRLEGVIDLNARVWAPQVQGLSLAVRESTRASVDRGGEL